MSALAAALCAAASALTLAPAACAKTYTDVPKGYWARAEIAWVTNRGPAGAKALDDFTGHLFKPRQAVTREQLARALVVVGGLQNDQVGTVALPDVATSDPDYRYIQIAVHLRLLTLFKDGFHPTAAEPSWEADAGAVRLLRRAQPHRRLDHAEHAEPGEVAAEPGLEDRRAALPADRGRGPLPGPALQPPRRQRRPRGLAARADRPRRGGRDPLPGACTSRRGASPVLASTTRSCCRPSPLARSRSSRSPSSTSVILTCGAASIRPDTPPTASRPTAASTARASTGGS